jgi:hypothetical protein
MDPLGSQLKQTQCLSLLACPLLKARHGQLYSSAHGIADPHLPTSLTWDAEPTAQVVYRRCWSSRLPERLKLKLSAKRGFPKLQRSVTSCTQELVDRLVPLSHSGLRGLCSQVFMVCAYLVIRLYSLITCPLSTLVQLESCAPTSKLTSQMRDISQGHLAEASGLLAVPTARQHNANAVQIDCQIKFGKLASSTRFAESIKLTREKALNPT